MNPAIKEIKINTKNVEIAEKFKRCISLGMKIEIWTTWWYAGKCHLKLMPKKQVYIT